MSRFPLAAALLAALVPAAANASSAPLSAWDGKTIYRQNLVACISRTPSCDRASLSQDDRDYLTYEMRDQRFTRKVVEQVADVRMEIYGGPVPVIHGKATGTRYASTAPDPVAPPQGSAWNDRAGSGLAGLAEIAQTGATMLRGMNSQVN